MGKTDATITQLWPNKAKLILKEKGISQTKLRKQFKQIYFPWNEEYNNYRTFYKAQIQEFPLFIIAVISIKEIKKSLELANYKSLSLRVIAGRHSSNVQNPDFYIDMSHFTDIKLKDNILSVQGGLNQGRVYTYLNSIKSLYSFIHGTRLCHHSHTISRLLNNNSSYLFGGGSASSVCVSGITTGGGIGSFKRTYGLAVDTVKSFKIVVPPNEINKYSSYLKVDKCHNENLFWALRGCLGSNFGIVTEIKYILPKINNIIMYSLTFPWTKASEVLTLWLNTSIYRPNEFNEDISLSVNGNDKEIALGGLYVVPEEQSIDKSIEIIREQLQSLINLDGTFKYDIKNYYETISTLTDQRIFYPFSSTRIFMSSRIIDVDYIINKYNEAIHINGVFLFGIELLGGKIKNVSSRDTAYYPRQANFFYETFVYTNSSLDVEPITQFTNEVFSTIYDPKEDTVFVGFTISGLPHPSQSYYGKNSIRLEQIKDTIDPLGIMDFPQGLKYK